MKKFSSSAMLLSCVLMISFVAGGCERFQSPDKEECEEYVDHVIQLGAKDETKDEHPIVGRLLHLGAREVGKLTGDYQNAVRQCMSKSTKHQVRCGLGARDLEELEKCE